MDRWLSSTCAYQGYAGGFGIENVIKIATDCLERVWPDLTVVLDVDLETSHLRLKEQLDRMELKGRQYHSMVREGFLKLAQERDDFVLISSSGTMDQTSEKVWQAVSKYFEGRE
jgi:dTMP kinase